MDFNELRRQFDALWERHAVGELSDDAYLQAANKLTVRDSDGHWWTIGARTGKWYVSQGGAWAEATPPSEALAPVAPTPQPVAPTSQIEPASPAQAPAVAAAQELPLDEQPTPLPDLGAAAPIPPAPVVPLNEQPTPLPDLAGAAALPFDEQPTPLPDLGGVASVPLDEQPTPLPDLGIAVAQTPQADATFIPPAAVAPLAPVAASVPPAVEEPAATLMARVPVQPTPPAQQTPSAPTPPSAGVASQAGPRFCPKCGQPLDPGARFCGVCGLRLDLPAQPAAPSTPLAGPTPGVPFEATIMTPRPTAPQPSPATAPRPVGGLAPAAISGLGEPTAGPVRPATPPPAAASAPATPAWNAPTLAGPAGPPPLPPSGAPGFRPAGPPPPPGFMPSAPMPVAPPPAWPNYAPAQPPPMVVRGGGARKAGLWLLGILAAVLVTAGGLIGFSLLQPRHPLSERVSSVVESLLGRGGSDDQALALTPTVRPTLALGALPTTAAPTRAASPTVKPSPTATPAPTTAASPTVKPSPTATSAPTATLTPTAEPPTATATAAPPTNTPAPPTNTPIPPSKTPVPPTNTPVPPTAQPVTLLTNIPISNGSFGQGAIWVEHLTSIFVMAGDGHKYRVEIGFLSDPAALAEVQRMWGLAGRGGANWRMRIQVRETVSWVACTSDKHACYDNLTTDGTQALFTMQLHLKDYVWQSLLNDHLSGGWQKVSQNQYYAAVQAAVFTPMANQTANRPCLGISYTRAD